MLFRSEGEIAEAAHVFTEMGCDEQMWDYEGKGADVDVVLKLLQRNPEFFRSHPLGRDCRLTLRIPNPTEERELRKKTEEALHSITTAYDIATAFYQNTEPPIFEVILPFTTSAEQLVLVDSYYRQEVAGKGQHALPGGKKVASWLGDYLPESINVIPLVEDRTHLLEIDKLVEKYLTMLDRKVDHLRVFVARSDPALQTGMVAATLLAKVALGKLAKLEQRAGVPIYPIIGVGGVPFRGNFRPHRVNRVLEEYPSVRTFTVQSSFKFDHPASEVQEAIERLKTASQIGRAHV